MKVFTVADAARAIGGQWFIDEKDMTREVRFVTSDSRQAGEGALFVAICGARVDGHDFIEGALANDASLCIGERDPKDASEMPFIKVDSSLAAVGRLAAWYRSLFDIPVVGITGSVGKTTTKEMVWSVLRQKYETHKTQKNFNNELGVPQTLLAMPEDSTAAVIEMGISDFGEMSRLTAMVKPTVAVMSIIGYSHLEFLGDREGVLRAKGEIFEGVAEDGVAVLNGDDDLLCDFMPPVRRVTYGLNEGNDYVASNVENLGQDGVACTIRWKDEEISVTIPAYGTHMVYAALAGTAVGDQLGLSAEEIRAGIEAYETVGRRAHIEKTDSLVIVDDCYNANPSSVSAAIASLDGAKGRRVCILGDMLELGTEENALHEGVGKKCADAGVELLLATGELSKYTVQGAAAMGERAKWFCDKPALIAALPDLLQKGDTVLVKASHSRKFEEITEALLKLEL
ncbi:MAG: UDP-N-acetylmuramoyl-tripeptide--D-alanyl-D-alanine ligase [Clostridia bacterium]|nr:UDP-N-acetylmuramoyl-tripeptide--D-alanyl-D-alanine ligase [Clostridia bacterium]